MYITKKGMYSMAINFVIENKCRFLSVHIENYEIDLDGMDFRHTYSIYYNKERALGDIRDNIKSIGDIDIIRSLSLNILSLIKDNLNMMNSKFEYDGINVAINKKELKIFNDKVVSVFDDFSHYRNKDWVGLLTEVLVNLRKYILNLKELVSGHVIINNTLIKEGNLVRVKKKLYKIEKLCITPGNRDICIVKYMFNPEYYVEYESDLIKYVGGVTIQDSKMFEDYYRVVGGHSIEEKLDRFEPW